MRIVTLEEHFTVPALTKRIDPALILQRGFPTPDKPWSPARQAKRLEDLGEERIKDMDAHGISTQVLSVAGPGADLLSPEEGPGWAREINDLVAQAAANYPGRYACFAHLPLTNPVAAVAELERAVKMLGFRGALVNGTTGGRFLDDPVFEPLLACAEALDVPLYVHPGLPPATVREAYYGGLAEPIAFGLSSAGWGWHSETALHVLRLVLSGTLDRHPRLQLIIGHMGEGLPAMLARCDQVFARATPDYVKRTVSQTILDQVHVTTSGFFSLPPFLALLQTFGVDRILFSVDYPFSDNAAGRAFLETLPVPPSDLSKIAHGNADRLLKLES